MEGPLVHKSGTEHCVSLFPAGPLEPHIASSNRVLVGEPDGVLAPHAPPVGLPEDAEPIPYQHSTSCVFQKAYRCGLSCGAILLCDLRPRAARALVSPPDCVSGRVPFLASTRRATFECTRIFIRLHCEKAFHTFGYQHVRKCLKYLKMAAALIGLKSISFLRAV